MRRGLILTAAAVVLAANLSGVWQASRNRSEPRGGRLELTEEELHFEPAALESTAILLHLQWRVRREEADERVAPGWLDTAKLRELGFDCRMAVDSPGARGHYTSTAPRPAYLVLELAADSSTNATVEPKKLKRLEVVDAGPEPTRLRARYPDADRSAIVRGVVGLVYRDRDYRTNEKLPAPRLEGRIHSLSPGEIFVPRPYSQLLSSLRRDEAKAKEAQAKKQRFKATICWGTNYEPWIADLRLLAPAP